MSNSHSSNFTLYRKLKFKYLRSNRPKIIKVEKCPSRLGANSDLHTCVLFLVPYLLGYPTLFATSINGSNNNLLFPSSAEQHLEYIKRFYKISQLETINIPSQDM